MEFASPVPPNPDRRCVLEVVGVTFGSEANQCLPNGRLARPRLNKMATNPPPNMPTQDQLTVSHEKLCNAVLKWAEEVERQAGQGNPELLRTVTEAWQILFENHPTRTPTARVRGTGQRS